MPSCEELIAREPIKTRVVSRFIIIYNEGWSRSLFIISRHANEVTEAGTLFDLFLIIIPHYSQNFIQNGVRAVSLEPLGVGRSYFAQS